MNSMKMFVALYTDDNGAKPLQSHLKDLDLADLRLATGKQMKQ